MKHIFSPRILIHGSLLVCLFTACRKDQEVTVPARSNILSYIAKDPHLTLLETAIKHCGLDTSVFTKGGPYTVFCPVDSAFMAAGLTADSINRYNRDSLSRILKYQILSGKFSSTDVIGFVTASVTSLDSVYKPFIQKNYFGIFLNGIPVTEGNIELGDGVIQKIGKVAFPPTKTVLQMIDSLPELSYFAAMVKDVPQFSQVLSQFNPSIPYYSSYAAFGGDPGLTVLAPINSGFLSSAYPSIDIINQTDPAVFNGMYPACFLNGCRFTSNFMGRFIPVNSPSTTSTDNTNNRLVEIIAFPTYRIDKDGLTTIPNYPPGIPPRITVSNILCTDGVIQEVDQVFISGS